MMKLYARPARIWSAVTCHRFYRFGDLSPKQGRVQRPGRDGRLLAFDGDKSPAESADESAHSKVTAASPRWVIRGSFRGLYLKEGQSRPRFPRRPSRLPLPSKGRGPG